MASCNKYKVERRVDPRPTQAIMASGTRALMSSSLGDLRVFTLAGDGTPSVFSSPAGVAVDGTGTIYVADASNNRIQKITAAGVVSTLAGSGAPAFADGTGTAATFNHPAGVAVDGSGNVYVADSLNHAIRKISPAGVVITLAGNGTPGNTEGPASAAEFTGPTGVAVDGSGNVYVADQGNHKIRKITPDGLVNTLAGTGVGGLGDGPGFIAQFRSPAGIAVDGSGNVYIADKGNNAIRMIASGSVSTLAASGFNLPTGVAVDASGTVYVADRGNHQVKTITPAGAVSIFAGNGTPGIINGTAANAEFNFPAGVAVSSLGEVYVADQANNRVREIGSSGLVSTVAGNGIIGAVNGPGSTAEFYYPGSVAADAAGNLYVADDYNQLIRKITPGGVVSTLAGNGFAGFTAGLGGSAQFNAPTGVATDASGNVYIADAFNQRIRKISPSGNVTTLAGSGPTGYTGGGYAEGPGNAARFSSPTGVALDASGNVYVADWGNNRIRKITPGGVVSTLAGNGSQWFADGPAGTATFSSPRGVAVDISGNVYVADANNNRIRKISPSGNTITLAGNGIAGFADGTGSAAEFNSPLGVAVDATGNVYVADYGNSRIRKITPAGIVSTAAGSTFGFVDGPGTIAKFAAPWGVWIDANGIIYVADTYNNRIRKIL